MKRLKVVGIIFISIILMTYITFRVVRKIHYKISAFERKFARTANWPLNYREHLDAQKEFIQEFDCKDIKTFKPSSPESHIEEKFAYPIPDVYKIDFNQNLNPDTFLLNSISFFCHGNQQSAAWKDQFIDQMITLLNSFSVQDKNALFFEYRFDYSFG